MKRCIKGVSGIIIFLFLFSCVSTGRMNREKKKTEEVSQQKTGRYLKEVTAESFPDKTMILVEASGAIKYTAFKLTEPLRLILDLSDMKISPALTSSFSLNDGVVNEIRYTNFKASNITRIEIGLDKIVPHRIIREGKDKILIFLQKSLEERTVQMSDSKLTGIIETISSPVQLEEEGEGDVPGVEEIVPDEVLLQEEESLKEEKKPAPPAEKYTGKIISLDFQDADVVNILRFIADISNFNIITSDDVKGKVNLKLNNVPWDQALDIILKTKGLGMEQEGNIIRIASLIRLKKEREELLKAKEMERQSKLKAAQSKVDAAKTKEQGEELFTEVIPINYATAGDILMNIEKLTSARGEIDINERTNTLIIKDSRSSLDLIKGLIDKLDKRTPQVVIEARIVEVSRSLSKDMGIQWGGLYTKTTDYAFPDNIALRGGISPASSTSDLALVNTLPGGGNFITQLPAAVGSGSGGAIGLSLGHIAGSMALDITLSALENSGNGKILSNPKITTEDNQEAIVESGRSIPYATVSQSGTSVQFVDASISLTVTPHITQDGYVSMKINVTKNDADFGNMVQGTPSILTKKANTQVLVKDGDTTVIGGLYTHSSTQSMAGIPLVSKIPILGWLFKKKSKERSSTELLIFITPKILDI